MRRMFAVVVVAWLGCSSEETLQPHWDPYGFESEDGHFSVRYTFRSGFLLLQAPLPLAMDSRARLAAYERLPGSSPRPGDGESDSSWIQPVVRLAVEAASSHDEEVIRIVEIGEDDILIEAVGAGNALLALKVKTQSGLVWDRVLLRASEVTRVEMTDGCDPAGEPPMAYPVDSGVGLRYGMWAGERRVIGYGHYPFEIQPDGAAGVDPLDDLTGLRIETGAQPGEVTFLPIVEGSPLEIRLVDRSEIDALELLGEGAEVGEMAVGDVVHLDVRPWAGLNAVCGLTGLQAQSLTPEICSARSEDQWSGDVRIRALAPGTCEIDIFLPRLGAEPVTRLHAITVI